MAEFMAKKECLLSLSVMLNDVAVLGIANLVHMKATFFE